MAIETYAQRVGLRVKVAKQRARKSNTELGEAIGVNADSITARLSGRKQFQLNELELIAPVVGVALNDLTQE